MITRRVSRHKPFYQERAHNRGRSYREAIRYTRQWVMRGMMLLNFVYLSPTHLKLLGRIPKGIYLVIPWKQEIYSKTPLKSQTIGNSLVWFTVPVMTAKMLPNRWPPATIVTALNHGSIDDNKELNFTVDCHNRRRFRLFQLRTTTML